jgi:CubicO group peptidase (beta-lactamase class C family)
LLEWSVSVKTARLFAILFLLASLSFAQQPNSDTSKLQGVDGFAEQLLKEWNVPGLGIGIIHNGTIVLEKGYGYRNLEDKLPFTTKTLFPVGSTSKSFTALALAILKDKGKVDWDDRVRQYLPSYELSDPVASERMTIRDLLLHRSGLSRNDLMWYGNDFTRKQIFDRLKYLPMGKGFRNGFDYNNLGYMTAGYLAGEVAGSSWEDLVRTSILTPLGMTSTNFSDTDSAKSPDYALPYDEINGKIERIPFASTEAIGPAGSVHSTVDEFLRYAEMLLAHGKFEGKQIVSEANLKTIQSPQIMMGAPSPYPEQSAPAYGMAWVNQTYRGHRFVWHNGGIDGFYTLLALLPDDNIGVVIFTNRLDRPAAEVLLRNVFDRMLGMTPVDWDSRFHEAEGKAKKAEEAELKKIAEERKPGTQPSHPLKDYAGTYSHPAYGNVVVTVDGDHLKFGLNRMASPLEHYHFDVFIVPHSQRPLGDLKVRFDTAMSGDIESVAVPLEEDIPEVVFKRENPAGK